MSEVNSLEYISDKEKEAYIIGYNRGILSAINALQGKRKANACRKRAEKTHETIMSKLNIKSSESEFYQAISDLEDEIDEVLRIC